MEIKKKETKVLEANTHNGLVELLAGILRVRDEAKEATVRLETAIEKIGKMTAVDAHPPAAMAQKAEGVGETKGKLNILSTILLAILAGVFIGLGAMLCTVVTTGTGLGFGLNKLLGGLVFCLGLILVVVAGAELFTGNTLIMMSWMSGRTSLARLLRNWGLVYVGNLVGALSLVGLMFYTHQFALSGYGVGANALAIANAKVNLTFTEALTRGILCNALVCLAVWLCFSARTVTDKIMAIIFPITAFVAAGFEHSVANMYFIPMGILLAGEPSVLNAAGVTAGAVSHLNWAGFAGNMIPVTIGNIIGGGILIGAVYWIAYLRQERAVEVASARPWVKTIFPSLGRVAVAEPPVKSLDESLRSQIEDVIRASEKKPAMLDRGGKALLAILGKARDDSTFMGKLSENPARALEEFDLTTEEKAALASGDIKWVESRLGTLDEPLRGWLTARLAQEKW
jgi:formate transporter